MQYKPKKEFTRNGFKYTLIKYKKVPTDHVKSKTPKELAYRVIAMYDQFPIDGDWPANKGYYEILILVPSKSDYRFPNSDTIVPKGTLIYPGTSQWGIMGFTAVTLKEAESIYNNLITKGVPYNEVIYNDKSTKRVRRKKRSRRT